MSHMKTPKRSDRAMAAALAELEDTSPQTAALLMFYASATRLRVLLGDEDAAGLIYNLADAIAVGKL
jgi:hypothetical protein